MTEDIECPVKNKCSDYPQKCPQCRKNTGKKSYYEPPEPYYVPPSYPTYWPFPIWPPDDTTWKPYYPKKPQWWTYTT